MRTFGFEGQSGEVTLGDEVTMPDESNGELLSESFEPAEDTPLELQPSEKAHDNGAFRQ